MILGMGPDYCTPQKPIPLKRRQKKQQKPRIVVRTDAAVDEGAGDALGDLDRFRQRERAREAAVPTLDAMKLLAREVAAGHGHARPTYDDAVLFDVNLDLVARQAGKLGGQHELARGLVQVDRRRPSRGVGTDQLANLLLERE